MVKQQFNQFMRYEEIPVPQSLKLYLTNFWKFSVMKSEDTLPFDHLIIPDGCCSIVYSIFSEKNIFSKNIFGPNPSVHFVKVMPGMKFIGIRIRPGLTESMIGKSGLDLRNQNIRIETPLLNLDDQYIFNYFEDMGLIDNISRKIIQFVDSANIIPDLLVQKTIDHIYNSKGAVIIKDWIEKIPISERPLQKRFKSDTGLTMKEFARVIRMRSSFIDLIMSEKEYLNIVFDSGFFDQAHFARDFTRLSGISIIDFKKYIQRINHVNVNHLTS